MFLPQTSYPAFHYLNSITNQWQLLPTFLVGEYLFYLLTIVALIHALKSSPLHLLIWFASLLTGTANDVFFMFLPVVDNFWQAQSTVMLNPRLPLYIPCVYTCFMYYSTIAAWRLNASPFAAAALAGVFAIFFYGPYDIVGAKFLWWSWHESDLNIYYRLLGAPIASTLWILTFTASFSYLLDIASKRNVDISLKKSLLVLLICCLCSTPLMIIQMTIFEWVDPNRVPNYLVFTTAFCMYLVIIFGSLILKYYGFNSKRAPLSHSTTLLAIATCVYYLTLSGIAVLGLPEEHVSTGVHQTYGSCASTKKDISGHIRREFFCDQDHDRNFTVDCRGVAKPNANQGWYTICGLPSTNYNAWISEFLFISAIGFVIFIATYTKRTNRDKFLFISKH